MSPLSLTPLDQRYGATVRGIWASVLGTAARSWADLGSYRDADVARFQNKTLPVLLGGQRNIASLTASYLEQVYQEIGGRGPRVQFDPTTATGRALRGVDPTEVYRRPFVEVYTALAQGADLDEALKEGANRLEIIAKTDLQLARTHTVRDVAAQQPGVEYTIRELQGEYNCALCLIASTQRYNKRNLAPIHPGCDCLVKTVKADYDPGQVVDEAKLEAIHKAVADALGQSDRGGRAVDYRKIIVSHDHGEIGPVLGFKGQNFTGPSDIKIPT